ncbi:MAG: redoxin domain-containing protein [Blastocatellia bacterium]|nr:redoxin domain-containing protein [Blastocatellia bacterium]MCS7158386.1 redoxin domain-containing protein [Blastocatellia bacterium]MCX7752892.1 redoxin domain-containing protein [Blastocatellia bacterium]MDW8167948.1 redoxin domain-containing protein [Acidobacteriota bacterium]MDW8255973.1 redoxin domain-containing protein [Acidobacteriota bacterium]
MSGRRLLALFIIGTALGLLIAFLVLLRHSLERERALGPGRTFPSITVRALNRSFELQRVPSGRKTLLVLFRPDCPQCENELGRLERVCVEIPVEKLDCVALSFGSEEQTYAWQRTRAFRRMMIAVSADPAFAERHRDWLMAVPLVFLITERGVIHDRRAGERSQEYTLARVREFVR